MVVGLLNMYHLTKVVPLSCVYVSSVNICFEVLALIERNAFMLSTLQVNVAIPFAYPCFHKKSMQFAWGRFYM